ncbi:sulfide:quinone oxidoreductase, mitochondrial [Bradysia coprophila]|uniref:sulfide:quinone oxidoreductase, mitochondrial n=1 Tax=Bradysia coprophila TaxID=38358 RepID=UPI00187D9619|nr:sulfide:quinone oxidoreductase, mitochondrial [Bradysia coprophila]
MNRLSVGGKCFNKSSARLLSTCNSRLKDYKCKILVVGGGTGGCSIAAKLTAKLGNDSVIIVEPNERHYYQPMFTMIGGGMKTLSQSNYAMKSVLPKGAKWLKDRVCSFDPSVGSVKTTNGSRINYDVLVLALGMELRYDKIPGLQQALDMPNSNVTSIYSPKYVERHFQNLQKFEKGNIVFTFPASPVKCPGAPQKICYITEDYLRRNNKRDNAKIIYNTALPVIFGVKYFADALWKVVKKRDIEVNTTFNLIEVIPDRHIAVFQNVTKPEEKVKTEYAILHAVPPQAPPSVLAECKDLTNDTGFVNVHKDYLQHTRFPNVFAIGDCSSSPNSKTMAAIASQSAVVCNNIISFLNGTNQLIAYDGYASCPLVTGYDRCIMAEFDYDLKPKETFPFAQNVERYSMFLMKRDVMPALYWKLMLNGRWNGPETMRKIFSIVKFNKQN